MVLKSEPGKRGAGLAILVVSIVVFFLYAYFLIFSGYSIAVMEATILAAVAVLLTVLGWIGYTMLTAPRAQETT
jgi:uncharacterized membrane protein